MKQAMKEKYRRLSRELPRESDSEETGNLKSASISVPQSDSIQESKARRLSETIVPISMCTRTKDIDMEFSDLTIKTEPMDSKVLSEDECGKLQELLVANEVMEFAIEIHAMGSSLSNADDLTWKAVERLVGMCEKLTAFRKLNRDVQRNLIYGGCSEMMILRSIMAFDEERWKNSPGPKSEAESNFYEDFNKFITSFNPQWREDKNIMLLMWGIVLYSPNRPNIFYHKSVADEQNTYYYLLYRYLNTLYDPGSAKAVYLKLLAKIEELRQMNENHLDFCFDDPPENVESLIKKVFDHKL